MLLLVHLFFSLLVTADSPWQPAPSMKHTRAAHTVVSTSDAIYALAGTGAGGRPVLEVERFDGQTWHSETTLPAGGLNAPAAAVLNNRIYLIGGFSTTTNVPVSLVQVYDIISKKWIAGPPLPAPRGGHAAVVFQNRIHVLGGGNSVSTLPDHSVFDPATNQWSQLTPLPRSEGSPAVVAFGDKLYAIGGRSGFSDFGDVFIYDPKTDRWSTGPAIEPRGTAGAVVYHNAIHLFGGESQARRQCLNDSLRLDPQSMKWEKLTPMPTARNFARAVLFQDAIYIVGGSPLPGSSHASPGSNIVERYSTKK